MTTHAQTTPRVLVADDQPSIIDAMLLLLKAAGIGADRASTPDEVAEKIAQEKYELVLMDMNYARDTTSGAEGLELLERIKIVDPAISIVVMTAWSTVDIAVASLQHGASDFIQKPWDNAAALKIIQAQMENTRARRKEMAIRKAEIEEAVFVQRTLMGATLGQFGRFSVAASTRTQREVGGDYFDTFEIAEDQLALCVADVMGKGMGAALVMANIQAHFRTLAQSAHSPAKVSEKMNANLLKTLGSGRLVTMFNAQLQAGSGRFTFSSAGHPAAVLVRASGEAELLSTDDAVLGSIPNWEFHEQTRELFPGDRVVVVSDGYLECVDSGGDELGQAKLVEWTAAHRELSAQELHDRLSEHLISFCSNQLDDDVTLMVISG